MDNKIKGLIEKLISKTKSGKAHWGKTSSENEYKLAFKNAMITSDTWFDNTTGMQVADFIIRNNRGDTIQQFVFHESEDGFELLKNLNASIVESYFKVDETINDIFNELDSDKDVGKKDDPLPF
ncbi:MAG: hypothetical protein VX798_06615 [Bacteroidota bacterium]|nr:hypothetical protein [Bacteroidota bacterium]